MHFPWAKISISKSHFVFSPIVLVIHKDLLEVDLLYTKDKYEVLLYKAMGFLHCKVGGVLDGKVFIEFLGLSSEDNLHLGLVLERA